MKGGAWVEVSLQIRVEPAAPYLKLDTYSLGVLLAQLCENEARRLLLGGAVSGVKVDEVKGRHVPQDRAA